MRIAFVHSFYSSRQPSGENLVVEAEVAALRKAGCEVNLFAAHTDEFEGDRLYPVRAALRVASGRGRSPLKAIRQWGPDVVHIHNLFPNFGRRWVEALNVPVVHTLHNYRPLCANGLLLRDGAICTRCPDGDRWAGVRYGCYRGSRLATLPLAWANRHGPMGDPLVRRADRLVVMSEHQRRLYGDAGAPFERMVVSPNFLPSELDPGWSDQPARSSGWLFVGRLSDEKGIVRLLEYWPKGEALTIIGDGPRRAEVERLAGKVGAEVLGSLTRDLVLKWMRRARGLVFPSMWLEGAPLVYPEALACGLPVIAFEPTTLAASVKSDRTGSAVSWEGQELGAALIQVRHARRAFGARCRDVFESKYSERAYARRATELYHAVAGYGKPGLMSDVTP